MKIHQLLKSNNKKSSKRVGRGFGSGKGKTGGRGTKGQKARAGHNIPNRFEGGQTSLILRMPKKSGFRSQTVKPSVIGLDILSKKYQDGEVVSPKTLFQKKLIESSKLQVKILSNGKLTKKLQFQNCQMSKSAQKAAGIVVKQESAKI